MHSKKANEYMTDNKNNVVALFENSQKPSYFDEVSDLHHALDMLETQIENIQNFGDLGKDRAISLARENILAAKQASEKIETLAKKRINQK